MMIIYGLIICIVYGHIGSIKKNAVSVGKIGLGGRKKYSCVKENRFVIIIEDDVKYQYIYCKCGIHID